LRPHYAHIEAKRLAQRFGDRKPDLKAAAELIDSDTVMTSAEIKKSAELAAADGASAGSKAMGKKLKAKIGKSDVGSAVVKLVDSL
jgi:aspartyl-tRNA synthetase